MSNTNNTGTQGTNHQIAVAATTEKTVDIVLAKIHELTNGGGLKLPANYSAENAVRAAWLIIQETKDMNKRPALEVCTKESVATSLLDMVIQGLNPLKKQGYFIVYGNKLVWQRSYMGTITLSKRVAGVKDVKAVPIYEGDQFKYEIDVKTGRKAVTEHVQDFLNIDPQKLKGAYAVVTLQDGTVYCEIMNMKQIQSSWNMGKGGGNTTAHKNFPDEMACKTVIGRALKVAIGSTDDADLFEEDEQPMDPALATVTNEISNKANKTELDIDEAEVLNELSQDAYNTEHANEQTAEQQQAEDNSNTNTNQSTLGPGF